MVGCFSNEEVEIDQCSMVDCAVLRKMRDPIASVELYISRPYDNLLEGNSYVVLCPRA